MKSSFVEIDKYFKCSVVYGIHNVNSRGFCEPRISIGTAVFGVIIETVAKFKSLTISILKRSQNVD